MITLVSQKREGILMLATKIGGWFEASETHCQEAVDAVNLDLNVLANDAKIAMELQSAEGLLKDLCSFVIGAMEQIAADEMAVTVRNIAIRSVNLIANLVKIVAERNSRNDTDAPNSMPSALPHLLVKPRGREFAEVIRKQKDRLSMRWSSQKILKGF